MFRTVIVPTNEWGCTCGVNTQTRIGVVADESISSTQWNILFTALTTAPSTDKMRHLTSLRTLRSRLHSELFQNETLCHQLKVCLAKQSIRSFSCNDNSDVITAAMPHLLSV
eukprot:c8512_g1_i1.p2 GENE.c8512_g1_i1~~c8512_g1_i1.p2  ORF type:complete len:112 (-),score=39.77 c8512_g1_i1:11-346(-)